MSEVTITRSGVVMPVRLDPRGLTGPTPAQARSKKWRRVARGWYVPSGTDSDRLDQRIVEAIVGHPPGTAVTGWAALAWLGAFWFDGLAADGATRLPVPVALDDRRATRPRKGCVPSEDWLFDSDVIVHDGVPITVPLRSVSYQARRAKTLPQAVQVIDSTARFDLISLDELEKYVVRLPCRQGVVLLRDALALADENVWSPQEPTMRCAWIIEGRRPRPLTNRPIFDLRTGRHLFTPDLFDPVAGVAGEYDGSIHDKTKIRRRDLNRDELFRTHGIERATMISIDRHDATDFVHRLNAAYGRATARPSADRTWTLDQPDNWVDTSTVAARRALSGAERAVWLRRT